MSDDNEIRDQFKRARQADRSEAPSYVRVRLRVGDRPGARTRRPFLMGALGTVAAGALIALAAVPLVRVWGPSPAEPVSALSVPVESPRVVAAPSDQPRVELLEPPTARPTSVPTHPKQDRSRAELLREPGVNQNRPARPLAVDETDALAKLPVVGSNHQTKVVRAPGLKDTDGDGNPNVHGARDTGLQTRMDGRNVTDPVSGTFGQNLNPDVIKEMEVVTAAPAANFGRADGGFANIIPKSAAPEPVPEPLFNTESYAPLRENEFSRVGDTPVSTFSIDVDTASYSVVRRFLNGGSLPPRDAVRLEEMINYFPYHDDPPRGNDPFSVRAEIASCPWAPDHRLARIALRGREVAREEMEGSNLVFLVDVSGSMDEPTKLPLVQWALKQLAAQLGPRDEVSIVVYAGSSGLVLPPTRGSRRNDILAAVDNLRAGGSTNGGEGLRLAYATARRGFVSGGINRVILATDGDFNVGITDQGDLIRFVEDQAKAGVFLTVLGFGMGNYKDDRLEQLADRGNGNYAYIDSQREARKALVEQIGGTLLTIAKDVKIQVEFNPAEVGAYRLIGYENRMLRREDFNDDTKDAGEIGAGHTVTALYELVPRGVEMRLPGVDPLKYQSEPESSRASESKESFTVKLRYKEPEGEKSRLLELPVTDDMAGLRGASDDLRFAAAVAAFGMILRESPLKGRAGYEMVLSLAQGAMAEDAEGHRREFVRLVRQAAALRGR